MAVENWSDQVVVARLADDPQLTEDLLSLEQLPAQDARDIVLDFSGVNYINSSHLGRVLRLRKRIQNGHGRIILSGMGTQVWGAFMVTGLDKVFQCTDDLPTALASLQMAR